MKYYHMFFSGMERTTHWAALYFVLLMTFGNYVLFNLLVAILVEGFSKQDELFDVDEVNCSFEEYIYKIGIMNTPSFIFA